MFLHRCARWSYELFFEDLGLDSKEYLKRSSRARVLRNALKELRGARLTTGFITSAELEATKDKRDFKVVIRKGSRQSLASPSGGLEVMEDTHTDADGQMALEAIDEQRVELEVEENTLTSNPPTTDRLLVQARDLVNYFYKLFHNTEKSYPPDKAINQAIVLIAQHGEEVARYVIDFSHKKAPETNYKPQTFGGILQYTSRAIAAYDTEQARRKIAEAITRCILCDQNGWLIYEDAQKHSATIKCPHDRECITRAAKERGWTILTRSQVTSSG